MPKFYLSLSISLLHTSLLTIYVSHPMCCLCMPACSHLSSTILYRVLTNLLRSLSPHHACLCSMCVYSLFSLDFYSNFSLVLQSSLLANCSIITKGNKSIIIIIWRYFICIIVLYIYYLISFLFFHISLSITISIYLWLITNNVYRVQS